MEQEIDWTTVLQAWPTPVFVAGAEGQLIFLNQALKDLNPDQASTLAELLSPDYSSASGIFSQAVPRPAEPVKVSVKLAGGQVGVMTLAGLPGGNQVMGEVRLTTGEGLSQIEKLEEVINKIRILNHDFNQPLTVILGQAEILSLRQDLDPDVGQRLETIISEAERLGNLNRRLSSLIHQRHLL